MVEQMRCMGDRHGADKWRRIIVAIGELGDRRAVVRQPGAATAFCGALWPHRAVPGIAKFSTGCSSPGLIRCSTLSSPGDSDHGSRQRERAATSE